jgi:mannose-1-phosphate guanylyltransferase / mannose-6-phosphate isomerase
MQKILPVIMCGGAGTRLWPESRETLPKQFIPLIGVRSTFQNTALLLAGGELFDKPIVISNHDYRFLVAEQLQEIGVEADIVLEPTRRDSGPAVAVAAELAAARSPSTIVVVMAADHNVGNPAALVALCAEAAIAAEKGHIVTLGIQATRPATGFGYIRRGTPVDGAPGVRRVEAFVEKPDEATAEHYVKTGYLWNSGNFIFRADVMKAEIARFEPVMMAAAEAAVAKATRDLQFLLLDPPSFAEAPKKSIDYAVMERTSAAAVIPADIGWSDVGTWSAVRDLADADAAGNSIRGRGIVLDSSNVHVRSDGHLTAVVGISGVIVVTTQDAVLVLGAKEADKVKDLVEKMKSEARPEALEHKRIYRPWGYYQSIDSGQRYQVKRLYVKPGGQLSLQRHHHRAEHWVVVKGTAEVTLDGKVSQVFENQSVYLPIGAVHRLANPGKIDLELIEVQTGSYLGEDDIVRIEDIYNRG